MPPPHLSMRNPFDHLAKKVGKEALDACGVTVHDGSVTVTLTPACAQDFARTLRPQAGRYQLAQLPAVSWIVQKTSIRDAGGNVVATIG